MRRAAASIPAIIAECFGKRSPAEKSVFDTLRKTHSKSAVITRFWPKTWVTARQNP
jgi:hypothetical protein